MASTLTAGPGLLTSSGGKRRGRKPGLNSTVAQRSAANARERSRMRVLSGAFVELKGALPWVPKDTKLSKLDTLKLAAGYIAYLRRILDTGSSFATALSTSVSDSDDVMTESDSLVGDVNPDHPIHLLRLAAQTDQPTTVRWVDSKQTDERQICSTDSSVYSELHSLEQFSVNNRLIDSIYHTVPAVRSEIPFPSMMKMSHPGLKEVLSTTNHATRYVMPKNSTQTRPEDLVNRTRNSVSEPVNDVPGLIGTAELSNLLAPSFKSVWNYPNQLLGNCVPPGNTNTNSVNTNAEPSTIYRIPNSHDSPVEFTRLSSDSYTVSNSSNTHSHGFSRHSELTYIEPLSFYPLSANGMAIQPMNLHK
ncbi:Transcription factor 21 [Fasciolopsis buskii]|uniref:Transcription factor 21 n=1 Tax=Fasciolopsis buskii TaxID=27845 RepID=A0A8E0VIB7_9TREM|nr:Transcription factor 21 [Fasciolopsis buski]